MQNLRPEVGQFGRLVEVHPTNGKGSLHVAGIVVVHAVYVGPYLYFVGPERRPYQRGAVVASSTAEVVDHPVRTAANESLGDRIAPVGHDLRQATEPDGIHTGLLPAMHEGGRMQQFGPASPLPQIQGEESGGQQLALCDDHPLRHLPRIGGSLRSHPGQCAFHRPGGLLTPANEQLFDAPHVFALQSGQQQRHLPVATARRSERSDPLQSVRRTGHGRKHHDSSSFAYKNICHPPHVGSAAHRSPAEFQNLHHSRFFIHQYNLRHKYIIFIFQKPFL